MVAQSQHDNPLFIASQIVTLIDRLMASRDAESLLILHDIVLELVAVEPDINQPILAEINEYVDEAIYAIETKSDKLPRLPIRMLLERDLEDRR